MPATRVSKIALLLTDLLGKHALSLVEGDGTHDVHFLYFLYNLYFPKTMFHVYMQSAVFDILVVHSVFCKGRKQI